MRGALGEAVLNDLPGHVEYRARLRAEVAAVLLNPRVGAPLVLAGEVSLDGAVVVLLREIQHRSGRVREELVNHAVGSSLVLVVAQAGLVALAVEQ